MVPVALLAALLVVLVVWVSASHPIRIWGASHLPKPRPLNLQPAGHHAARQVAQHQQHGQLSAGPWIIDIGVAALVVLALGLAIYLATAYWLRQRRERQYRRAQPTGPDPEALEALELPDELAAAAGAARTRLVESGEPRNAIVACWLSLEDAAARAGLARQPAETSVEFTARVLARFSVEYAAVETLSGLYREARFSRHSMTEAQRQRAAASLRSIERGLHLLHRLTARG